MQVQNGLLKMKVITRDLLADEPEAGGLLTKL
jgi:hypothetical protein